MDTDVIVVGAGLAGAAAARRLAKAGKRVRVIEARNQLDAHENDILYGENGALRTKGTQAFDVENSTIGRNCSPVVMPSGFPMHTFSVTSSEPPRAWIAVAEHREKNERRTFPFFEDWCAYTPWL